MPAIFGPNRNGGKITIGKDNNLYDTIENSNHRPKLQNFQNSEIRTISIESIYRIDPHSSSAHVVNPFTESDVSYVDKTFA